MLWLIRKSVELNVPNVKPNAKLTANNGRLTSRLAVKLIAKSRN